MFDMFKMLGKLNEAKSKMEEVKSELKNTTITESEMGGAVVVELSGDKVIKKITTSDEFYSKFGKDEREDMLAEAINNAMAKADQKAKDLTKEKMQGVIPDIPGVDVSSMLGML